MSDANIGVEGRREHRKDEPAEAPSDESGHADSAFALAIALPSSLDWAMTYDEPSQICDTHTKCTE